MITKRYGMLTMTLPLLLAGALRADTPQDAATEKKQADTMQKPPGISKTAELESAPDSATIDSILNQAVKNIAKRYNLNDAQTEKTSEIMRRDVYKFLREHEEQVWPAIRDLLKAQLGNKPPDDKEMMQRIGKAANSMMGMIEEAILRGNEEWRMYLNAEQKRMHDYDLAEMDRTFKQLEANFEAWAKGEPNPGPLFPPPPPPHLSPPKPKQPPQGLPEPEIEIFRPTLFETYVEEFIKKYHLDKAQIESARSILAEYQDKANDFKNSKKDELKKLALQMRTAHEQADRKGLQMAEAQRKELLKPVHELFGEMNERLMALLTTAQVQKFASADGLAPPADKASRSRPSNVENKPTEANKDPEPTPGPSSAKKNDG